LRPKLARLDFSSLFPSSNLFVAIFGNFNKADKMKCLCWRWPEQGDGSFSSLSIGFDKETPTPKRLYQNKFLSSQCTMARRAKGSVTWFHLILLARLVDAISTPCFSRGLLPQSIVVLARSRVGTRESTFFLPLYQPQMAAKKRYGKPIGHLTQDYKRRCPLRETSQTSLGLPLRPLKM